MERKERIAPPRLPNSKRGNSYRDSVELAEKAGASGGQMYHNGQWRDGYRVEGGSDRDGYNSHHLPGTELWK